MVLTVKRIAALDWVVQLRGFANAAERLNSTQSANTKRRQDNRAVHPPRSSRCGQTFAGMR